MNEAPSDIRKEMREMFIAKDGKAFDTCIDAEKHNDDLEIIKSRLKCIKFYKIKHDPDLTEGRGHYGLTFVALEVDDWRWEEWLCDFCFTQYGNAIQFVQGSAPVIGWSFEEITKEKFDQAEFEKTWVGDYSYASKVLFLSHRYDLDGFPEAKSLKYCHERIK